MRTLTPAVVEQTRLNAHTRRISRPETPLAEVWAKRLVVFMLVAWPLTFVFGFTPMLTIMNLAGLALAMIGLRLKPVGLMGIAVMCTLDTLTRNLMATGGLWRWNTLNYWLVLVILVNLPFLLRFTDIQSRLLQVFLVLLTVMLLISFYVQLGIQDILNIGATFGILYYFIRAIEDKKVLYWVGVVCGTTAALGGLAFYFQMGGLPYIDPNSLTQLPLTGLFAICFAMPQAGNFKRGRLVLLMLTSINIVWIFLSGSRGSLLTSFVCLAFLIVQMRSLTWTTLLIGVGLVLIFWFSNILLDQQAYALHRFSKFLDSSYTLAQRTSGRSVIFWTGWQIFLQRPLGLGTGSFRGGTGYLDIVGGKSLSAHSAWIKTLAENGAEGFLLLASWVLSFGISGLHRKDRDVTLIGLFTTAILIDVFVTQEFQGKNLWFLVAGSTAILNAEQYKGLTDKVGRIANRYRRRVKPAPKPKIELEAAPDEG